MLPTRYSSIVDGSKGSRSRTSNVQHPALNEENRVAGMGRHYKTNDELRNQNDESNENE